MSDSQGGLNAPVQQPVAPEATPTPRGKSAPFGQRPAKESGTPSAQTSQAFHSYKWDDGDKLEFKTPDELNKYIREGTLRHKDYTRKTQEAAELRKQIDKQREQIESQASLAARMENQWKPVDDWLKTRPDVVDYIKKNMGQASSGTLLEQSRGIMDETLTPLKTELEQLKAWKEEQESSARLEKMVSSISSEHPDFNEEAVMDLYRSLDEAPEGETERALVEMLYWASIGKNGAPSVRAPVTPGVRIPQATQVPFDQKGRWNPDMAKKRMRDLSRK